MKSNRKFVMSIQDDTFNSLKSDFDTILSKTLLNMEQKESEYAEITVKLKINITHEVVPTTDGVSSIKIPIITHKVNSVMQIKEEAAGFVGGNYALTFDGDIGEWMLSPIDDGQTSIYDKKDK